MKFKRDKSVEEKMSAFLQKYPENVSVLNESVEGDLENLTIIPGLETFGATFICRKSFTASTQRSLKLGKPLKLPK